MMRLALIGRGRWGANIERTLKEMPGVEVVLVEKGSTAPPDISGVLIATPSATHADVAVPYIERGIPTFIEKPMATSEADVARIVKAAQTGGGLVKVGYIYLHNPAFQEMVRNLDRIGPVIHVLSEKLNSGIRSDTSVYWDWLPHDLSMSQRMFGQVLGVRASCSHLARTGVCSAATVECRYANEVTVTSIISWHSFEKRRRLTVFGSRGTLVFDDVSNDKLALIASDGSRESIPHAVGNPLTIELADYLHAIATGARSQEDVAMSIQISDAIECAIRSAQRAHYDALNV